MNRRGILLLAIAVCGAALTACGDQQAAPTSDGTDQPATTSETAEPATLGPNGLGDLTLGMTFRQALANGEIENEPPEECGHASLHGRRGLTHVSEKTGVYGIYVDDTSVRTPEGIGMGSDLDGVLAAYPAGHEVEEGFVTPVPGNEKATYVLRGVTDESTVDTMTLIIQTDPCFTDDTLGDGK